VLSHQPAIVAQHPATPPAFSVVEALKNRRRLIGWVEARLEVKPAGAVPLRLRGVAVSFACRVAPWCGAPPLADVLVFFDLAIDAASAPRRWNALFPLGGDRVVFYTVLEERDEDAAAALEEETLSIAHEDTFVGEGLSVVRPRQDDAGARGAASAESMASYTCDRSVLERRERETATTTHTLLPAGYPAQYCPGYQPCHPRMTWVRRGDYQAVRSDVITFTSR
jgi:hypothetical protein